MKNIIVIYASMSGNTELMVQYVAEGMRKKEASVDIIDIFELNGDAETLELRKCDGILIGTYTWMDGDVPDEFLHFFEELPLLDLSKKKAAVFGSYDSLYGNCGAAVNLFIDGLKSAGAEILLPPLKVELSPTESEIEKCKNFGEKFISKL